MRVLLLSLDPLVLQPHSAVAGRLRSYGSFVSRLDVLVPHTQSVTLSLDPQVTLHASGGKSKVMQVWYLTLRLFTLLRTHRHGVISSQDAYFLGVLGLLFARLFQAGLEVQAHGIEKDTFLRRVLAGFVYRRADVIRVVSRRLQEVLMSRYGLPEDFFVVVPIFVRTDDLELGEDNPHLQAYRGTYRGNFNILSVGRLVPVKRVELQIRALSALVTDHQNAILHIVGVGPLKESLEALVVAQGLEQHVVFHGQLSRAALGALYLSCDVFLHTAASEGYGMVLAEALTSGIPIVATDVGCVRDISVGVQNVSIVSKQELEKIPTLLCQYHSVRSSAGTQHKLQSKEAIDALYTRTWERINTRG